MIPIPWLKLLPWAGGALALAILFGLGMRTGLNIRKGQVQEARAETAALRAEIGQQVAAGRLEGAQRLATALEEIESGNALILQAIEAARLSTAKQVQADMRTFSEKTSAPLFACLREPLPDDAAWVFARPGGRAP